MAPSASAPASNPSQGSGSGSGSGHESESDWTDEYAMSEESDFDQRQSGIGPSILSREIRTAPCSKSARPLKDTETRQNMIANELKWEVWLALLFERCEHGSPSHGPFPQATWSVTEAIRKRDAEEDSATEKLHGRSQSKVESEADGGWDECFDRLYVW